MHLGYNIHRFRSFRGMKQQDIAKRLKMTQQNYSLIEKSEHVDDNLLERISDILECDPAFIKGLPETLHIYSDNQQGGNVVNYDLSDSDKIIKVYERILKTERNRIKMLEGLVKKLQENRDK